MLCKKCKKNEAKINLVKIVNGEKNEIWLCENCAKDISDIPFLNSIDEITGLPFESILTGLLNNIGGNKVKAKQIICPKCNLSYSEFEKNGKLGCSECYNAFSDVLQPIIKRIHGSIKHIGKIPKFDGEALIKKRKIIKLKQELQNVIKLEEYEKAAVIRDQIKELETFIFKDDLEDKVFNVKEKKGNEKLDL
ncbi:UvrB/UvrC motif-containing protein [Clostridium uliginosum]|uniref:Protein arginine kinase activator n=1 Tax=Clostridium uliginosum TaxID=119641 RepID=A0A1I1M4U2_9CLOT|nr:UvrB/UvrC motif-containing protein [Clostridium uliginosum]SFC80411.1 protein arginine kinase activator [Clostridium uliginosum]